MRITTRFFALHRDVVGVPELELEVDEGTTAGEVWSRLGEQYPRLIPATRSLMFAINQVYADPATEVHDGDEVAFIPPVSGGSDSGFRPFVVTDQPLQSEPLTAYARTPGDGAIVLFAGVVRDNAEGKATAYLHYEAYAAMAEPVLSQIADEARGHWPIGRVAVHHRIGRLEIGETAVLVAVAAPHRHAAFAAAEYIMDRIKEIAPIWKRESWLDGTAEWIGDEERRGT
jgi:molybdopterin converting factor subunit 1